MSLPPGFAPLPFDPAVGLPQVVPLPGSPGVRIALVAGADDLARLMSASADQVVHDTAERLNRVAPALPSEQPPAAQPSEQPAAEPLHVVARIRAVAAFQADPPDSLASAAVPLWFIVSGATGVHSSWPARPGRALPVSGGGRLIGELWVDECRLGAGTLVTGGAAGSRIVAGWRPADTTSTTAVSVDNASGATNADRRATTAARGEEEDPYVHLV